MRKQARFGAGITRRDFVNGERLIAPQGANGFFVPDVPDDLSSAQGDPYYYAELGVPREFTFAAWPQDRKPLRFCRDNYGYLVVGLQRKASVGHFFDDGGGGEGCWAVDMFRNPMQVGDYRPPLDPGKPAVLSFYTPFHSPGLDPKAQVTLGRAELLGAQHERKSLPA